MILKFEEWLVDQQGREDEIGDLARMPAMHTVVRSPTRRAYDEHRNWVDIVIRSADPRHIPVFNEAWQEFLLAREDAEYDED